MSQENLEIVERVIRAVTARPKPDYETLNELVASDHVLVPAGAEVGIEEEAHGATGYRVWRDNLTASFSDIRIELKGAVDLEPDKVLAVTAVSALGRTSGAEAGQRLWNVITVRQGKVVRTEAYTDSAKALHAIGLSE